MSSLFTLPQQVVLTNAGALIPGAKAYFFAAGTATAQTVYTEYTLTTAHSQPVVADGNGRFPTIYLDETLDYKVQITDASDVEIYSQDFIQFGLTLAQLAPIIKPRTQAEINATVTPTDYQYDPGDVRRYGPTGVAVNATTVVQAAIDQAEAGGATWTIPDGVVCEVATTGSTTTPVGDALTVTASCAGVIDGRLVATNNCNVIHVTGDNTHINGNGSIEGYGTFFQSGADNGALWKNEGNDNHLSVCKLIDPPQYGVLVRASSAKKGGSVSTVIEGGPTSQSNPQHYACELEGLISEFAIDEVRVTENASNGKCVQGVGSGTTLGTPTNIRVGNVSGTAWDHLFYLNANDCVIGDVLAHDCGGSGIRIIGFGHAAGCLSAINCVGGLDLQSFRDSTIDSINIRDYTSVGFSLQPQFGNVADGYISNVIIGDLNIIGKSADTTVRTALRLRSVEASGSTETSQWNIQITNVNIKDAAQSVTAEGAVEISVGTGETFSRIALRNVNIDTTGYQGITKLGSGILLDADIKNINILNPGDASGASGSDTHGFRVVAGTLTRGCIANITCIDDRGTPKMVSGFSNNGTVSNDVGLANLVSVGHTTSPGTLMGNGYTSGDTTPSVRNRNQLHIVNSGAVTISNFDDGEEGQIIHLTFADANTTVDRTNAVLSGGVNFVSTADDSLTLLLRGSTWVEIARGVNS